MSYRDPLILSPQMHVIHFYLLSEILIEEEEAAQ